MMKKFVRVLVGVVLLGPTTSLNAQLVGVEFNTGSFYSISTSDGSLQLIAVKLLPTVPER